jgi:hypothetical protein
MDSVFEFTSLFFRLTQQYILRQIFDKIFDNYVTDRTVGTTIVKAYYDDDVSQLIRNASRIILKIHGTIDSPDRMIFGRAKYAESRVKHAGFYHLVDALLLTNTFFLLGCGLDDPDIQLLFEKFSYRFPTSQPHYMTIADSMHNDQELLLRDTRKLKLLRYSRAHDHKELEESLEALVTNVDKERQDIGSKLSW